MKVHIINRLTHLVRRWRISQICSLYHVLSKD